MTPYPWPAFLLAAAVFLALGLLWLNPPSRRANVTLIGVPCLFVALVLLLSFRRPILLPRILVLHGSAALRDRREPGAGAGRARFAVLLSLVAAFGTGLFFQVTAPNSDKEPCEIFRGNSHLQFDQADLVVLSPVSNPRCCATMRRK